MGQSLHVLARRAIEFAFQDILAYSQIPSVGVSGTIHGHGQIM